MPSWILSLVASGLMLAAVTAPAAFLPAALPPEGEGKKESAEEATAEKKAETEKPAEEKAEAPAEKPEAKEKDEKKEEKKDGDKAEKAEAPKEAAQKDLELNEEQKAALGQVLKAVAGAGRAPSVRAAAAAAEGVPSAEQGETKEKPKAKPKKAEPQAPMFHMRDGTRLAGYPEITQLNVETAYGKLVIPVTEVQRLRFATAKDTSQSEKVEALVRQLGSEEYDLREQAMEEIKKTGAAAIEALQKALESEDEEIRSRAEKLLGEIEEDADPAEDEDGQLAPLLGKEDEVVTQQFTVLGRVLEESFAVKTRYGNLTFRRQDIISVVFSEPLSTGKKFKVPGTSLAGGSKWFDTEVSIAKGSQFKVAASGSIHLDRFGLQCGPEGTTTGPGPQFESFALGALVGRVGDKGKAFLIGSSYEGKAPETGNLFLAIALRSGTASGEFEVELEVE
jgi:hypothetical protein